MDIICECGHSIEEHREPTNYPEFYYSGGCEHEDRKGYQSWTCCNCKLPPDVVEARFWARYYKALYDTVIVILDAQTKGEN
jgi:hypothetical protein